MEFCSNSLMSQALSLTLRHLNFVHVAVYQKFVPYWWGSLRRMLFFFFFPPTPVTLTFKMNTLKLEYSSCLFWDPAGFPCSFYLESDAVPCYLFGILEKRQKQ